MENDEQEAAFHQTLEPDIIIDDESNHFLKSDDEDEFDEDDNSKCEEEQKYFRDRFGPEISIIPVKKNPIKIKFVTKQQKKKNEEKVHRIIQRSPRQMVRLVSEDEASQAEQSNSNIKRKSLPLEKCPICKKFFRRMKTHLQKHAKVERNPNDPLTCRFCMKVFNTGSNLSIHMRTHTGDKPYICVVCSKGFAQSCNLVNHMRIHTGERPFKCPHCDRAFTQSGNLSNHVRLHTDEKPFKCHFCDKAFTQSGNLNSHIRNNHKFINDITSDMTDIQ